MKLKENSSIRKLRGAYYTPLPLAEKMVDFFKCDKSIRTILEPSCGDGVFIDALLSVCGLDENQSVTAVEIATVETEKLSKRYEEKDNIKIINDDFFSFYKLCEGKTYDLIVGNPPYIRYQYLTEGQRQELSCILKKHGMKENKLINAWVAFMVACVEMLSDSGRIAFVIPAEILQVAYAEDLRLYLSEKLCNITLLTFDELVFPDIEQEVVVFIGEKGHDEKGIRIIELANLGDLLEMNLEENGFQPLQHVHEKWTKYFTSERETALISQIRNDMRFQKLSDVALINVGITTGNNKYFSINKNTVSDYALQDVVRPLIGRSSHANSVFFEYDDWMENVNQEKAAYLIDFPDLPEENYPKPHLQYIHEGVLREENAGYKCRVRDRWYIVPSIWVPDAFFLRRNNRYPKFVLNRCNAVSTDTMHRIKFHEGADAESVVLSYYSSIAFAFTEICGRSYGGGVLEILPGEVGNIYVPKLDKVPHDVIHEALCRIDQIVRNDEDIERALDIVDGEILHGHLGFDLSLLGEARQIWKKLQRRRLRRGTNSR